jgi:cytochrome c oxidase assembly protein subunit 15
MLAILTAVATFPLIFVGGLVTSKGAGMSVPDWPNSFGYNMFALPWHKWIGTEAGGVFYEHFHRLKGTLVGLMALWLTFAAFGVARNLHWRRVFGIIALLGPASTALLWISVGPLLRSETITYDQYKLLGHVMSGTGSVGIIALVAWLSRRRDPRPFVRWLALGVLTAVIIQGVMGGLRVTEVSLELAIIHGCFGQAFFGLTAVMAVVTSRWWLEAPDLSRSAHESGGNRLVWLSSLLLVLIFAQLIAGAMMRHYGAGLAIPDLPLHYGQLVPPVSEAGVANANAIRAWEWHLEPVTLGQIWMHFAHRAGAIIVTLAAAWVIVHTLRHHRSLVKLTRMAWLLGGLMAAQFALGVLTVYLQKPAEIATAHVAVGALVLLVNVVLLTRAGRLFLRGRRQEQPTFATIPVQAGA